jgi:hypothetical protein
MAQKFQKDSIVACGIRKLSNKEIANTTTVYESKVLTEDRTEVALGSASCETRERIKAVKRNCFIVPK